jgi:hypothetical protein
MRNRTCRGCGKYFIPRAKAKHSSRECRRKGYLPGGRMIPSARGFRASKPRKYGPIRSRGSYESQQCGPLELERRQIKCSRGEGNLTRAAHNHVAADNTRPIPHGSNKQIFGAE